VSIFYFLYFTVEVFVRTLGIFALYVKRIYQGMIALIDKLWYWQGCLFQHRRFINFFMVAIILSVELLKLQITTVYEISTVRVFL